MTDLTCPECGEELGINEEWQLIKPWKKGTRIEESIQGDYAHAECASLPIV